MPAKKIPGCENYYIILKPVLMVLTYCRCKERMWRNKNVLGIPL